MRSVVGVLATHPTPTALGRPPSPLRLQAPPDRATRRLRAASLRGHLESLEQAGGEPLEGELSVAVLGSRLVHGDRDRRTEPVEESLPLSIGDTRDGLQVQGRLDPGTGPIRVLATGSSGGTESPLDLAHRDGHAVARREEVALEGHTRRIEDQRRCRNVGPPGSTVRGATVTPSPTRCTRGSGRPPCGVDQRRHPRSDRQGRCRDRRERWPRYRVGEGAERCRSTRGDGGPRSTEGRKGEGADTPNPSVGFAGDGRARPRLTRLGGERGA